MKNKKGLIIGASLAMAGMLGAGTYLFMNNKKPKLKKNSLSFK